jgi:multisubunit Na+/H+ antiporter MnhB subunit
MAAVIIFGAFSFFCAIYFAVLGAVDVAFTEAAVGAAITTLFFVTALYRAGERAGPMKDDRPGLLAPDGSRALHGVRGTAPISAIPHRRHPRTCRHATSSGGGLRPARPTS